MIQRGTWLRFEPLSVGTGPSLDIQWAGWYPFSRVYSRIKLTMQELSMRVSERAAQIWSVLALASKNRQVLTYDILSRLIGVPRPGLGQLLEPIQSYCLINKLPPLTILCCRRKHRNARRGVYRSARYSQNPDGSFRLRLACSRSAICWGFWKRSFP